MTAAATLSLLFAASVITAPGAGAEAPTPAEKDEKDKSSENKTEDFGIEFLGAVVGDETTVFSYELTYTGTGTGDDTRLSHLSVADFCASPVGVSPDFTESGKWDSESLAGAGQVYGITFDNDDIDIEGSTAATDGLSTWTLKKGSGEGSEKVVTSAGPECTDDTTTEVTCPYGETPPTDGPMVDDDGDGVADNCVEDEELRCPDDQNPPVGGMVDDDGDGIADNCVEDEEPPVIIPPVIIPPTVVPTVVECPEGTMPPVGESAVDFDGDGDADNCASVLPAAPITRPTAPEQPGEVLPAVQPQAQPAAVAPAAVAPPAVLGDVVTRSATLPRTGSNGTVPLTAVGLGLVLAGAAFRRTGKRHAMVR